MLREQPPAARFFVCHVKWSQFEDDSGGRPREGVICGFGHRRRLTLNGRGVEDFNCVAVNPLGIWERERREPTGGVKRLCEAHIAKPNCSSAQIRSFWEYNCHSLNSFPTTTSNLEQTSLPGNVQTARATEAAKTTFEATPSK